MVVVLGIVLLAFSFFSFCIWFFLFIDDNNIVQNRLTIWWSWAESAKTKLLSHEQNILRRIAAITTRGFDHIFGKQLISVRSISASICVSLASLGIMLVTIASFSDAYQSIVLPASIWSLFFVFLATTKIRWFRETICFVVLIIVALSSVLLFLSSESSLVTIIRPKLAKQYLESINNSDPIDFEIFRQLSDDELINEGFTVTDVNYLRGLTEEEFNAELQLFSSTEERDEMAKAIEIPLANTLTKHPEYKKIGKYGRAVLASISVVSLVLAICSDFAVILITRTLLRLSVDSQTIVRFMAIAVSNLVLAFLLFVIPFVLGFGFKLPYRFEMVFAMLAGMNWSVVLIAFSSMLVGITLTINRMVWPNLIIYLDSMSTAKVHRLRNHCRWLGVVSLGVSAELLGVNWTSIFFSETHSQFPVSYLAS